MVRNYVKLNRRTEVEIGLNPSRSPSRGLAFLRVHRINYVLSLDLLANQRNMPLLLIGVDCRLLDLGIGLRRDELLHLPRKPLSYVLRRILIRWEQLRRRLTNARLNGLRNVLLSCKQKRRTARRRVV